jgi:hypothetical protein
MRRIFTSPRLENVERVAALLKEEGIEARITHGRSYKGGTRSHFTYRDHARTEPEPAVWIVRPDDQPKARALMRDAGLLDSGRSPTSYLSTTTLHGPRDGDARNPAKRRMFLVKLALLIGIVVVLGVALFAWRKPASTTTPQSVAATSTTAQVQAPAPAPAKELINDSVGTAYRVEVPSALATLLLDAELRAHSATDICLSVDGAEPSAAILATLRAEDAARVRSRSVCAAVAANTMSVEVREYLTDGSGTGTVQVEIADYGKDGKRRVETRTLEVQRDGLQWEVSRALTDRALTDRDVADRNEADRAQVDRAVAALQPIPPPGHR